MKSLLPLTLLSIADGVLAHKSSASSRPEPQLQNANHIFNSIHSSMRQFGSSLNHNGMSVFLATVPEDTEFYHGTSSKYRVNGTEWLAFEPEHALMFARTRGPGGPGRGPPSGGPPPEHGDNQDHEQDTPPGQNERKVDLRRDEKAQHPLDIVVDSKPDLAAPEVADDSEQAHGYLHTYRTKHPLRLLYVDGQSAAKSTKGTLDVQDLVLLHHDPPTGGKGSAKQTSEGELHHDVAGAETTNSQENRKGEKQHHDKDGHGGKNGEKQHHDKDGPGGKKGEHHGSDGKPGRPQHGKPDSHHDGPDRGHPNGEKPHHPEHNSTKGHDGERHHGPGHNSTKGHEGHSPGHNNTKGHDGHHGDERKPGHPGEHDKPGKHERPGDGQHGGERKPEHPGEHKRPEKHERPRNGQHGGERKPEHPGEHKGPGKHERPDEHDHRRPDEREHRRPDEREHQRPDEREHQRPEEREHQRPDEREHQRPEQREHQRSFPHERHEDRGRVRKEHDETTEGLSMVEALELPEWQHEQFSAEGDKKPSPPHHGPLGEAERAERLCQIAHEEYDDRIDGILRMEGGFEIILCNFAKDLDVVQIAQPQNSGNRGGPGSGPPGGRDSRESFNMQLAVSARYDGIGGDRVHIDYENFVSLFAYEEAVYFDDAGLPRVNNETAAIDPVRKAIKHLALQSRKKKSKKAKSGKNWQAIADMVVTRYAERIASLASGDLEDLTSFKAEVDRALRPFIDYSDRNSTREINRCASQFLPLNTPSSHVSLAEVSLRNVTTVLCRTLSAASEADTLAHGVSTIRALKSWLAWTEWKRCHCSEHEICFLPIWPQGSAEDFEQPQCKAAGDMSRGRGGYWGGFGPHKESRNAGEGGD